jgi:hypothetical protein
MDDFATVNVSKKTHNVTPLDAVPTLDPAVLDAASVRAAEEFVAEGTPANTARSYASALRYWAAWYALRYGRTFGDELLPVTVTTQFVLDHLERQSKTGLTHELPPALDARLVELGTKARTGPLAYGTVSHRLAVLAKWHRLHNWDSPTDDHRLKTLLSKARKAQARRGVAVRKNRGDRRTAAGDAGHLHGWNAWNPRSRPPPFCLERWRTPSLGSGRPAGHRSAPAGCDHVGLRARHHQDGYQRRAAREAAQGRGGGGLACLDGNRAAPGRPLFRRLFRGGRVGTSALTGDQVARIVQRRARLAGLSGDWAAHSLRSGFVTEAGRQGVPLGEVMALTEHRGVATVMGYFQAGTLLSSRGTDLLGSPSTAIAKDLASPV